MSQQSDRIGDDAYAALSARHQAVVGEITSIESTIKQSKAALEAMRPEAQRIERALKALRGERLRKPREKKPKVTQA